MAKIKIAKMNIEQLSWCVATITQPDWVARGLLKVFPDDLEMDDGTMYLPASNCAQGAELLSQEGISCVFESGVWTSFIEMGSRRESVHTGATMLEAGMRTYLDIFNDGAFMEIPSDDPQAQTMTSPEGEQEAYTAENENFQVSTFSVKQSELF